MVGGAGSEPAFEGLVEALDLALGLGVAGGAVLLADAEHREQVFECVAAAPEPGAVDPGVVRERAACSSIRLRKLATTVSAVTGQCALQPIR